ncbi:twin-arginine translocase TatA/TatE family subunit [candidate division KSB1 bacterium]|nr:twin-arginine translocase TatA/TatE family subunit [candidate division KSB1 bacterium]
MLPSGWELIVICLVILLLFGGKKIPEIARGLGKAITEFRKGARDIKDEIDKVQIEEDVEEKKEQKGQG